MVHRERMAKAMVTEEVAVYKDEEASERVVHLQKLLEDAWDQAAQQEALAAEKIRRLQVNIVLNNMGFTL